MALRIARNIAGTTATDAKPTVRARLLARRRALPPDPAREAALAARVSAELALRNARCVGFYWPLEGECDLREAIAAWLAQGAGRQAALPVMPAARSPMRFHAWHPGAAMKPGRHGIAVPAAELDVVCDLLLLPCVGFDAQRLRLGYGGGYYDRTLAACAQRPVTVGVAYEDTRVDALPREPHDIPLDVIVTERARHA